MSSVSLVVYAGGPMDGELLDWVAASFPAPLYNMNGTTETMNSLYAKDPAGRAERARPGSTPGSACPRSAAAPTKGIPVAAL